MVGTAGARTDSSVHRFFDARCCPVRVTLKVLLRPTITGLLQISLHILKINKIIG